MKNVGIIGVLLLVLGLLAFVVPVPHSENHGVKIGDTKIGVQTQSSEKLPPMPWTHWSDSATRSRLSHQRS